MKKDIKNNNISTLDILEKLEFKSFKWKKDNSDVKIGLIAQEVEKIDSFLVFRSKYKGIDTYNLLMYNVKAIQELSAKNKSLEKRTETLESDKKALEERLNKLEETLNGLQNNT